MEIKEETSCQIYKDEKTVWIIDGEEHEPKMMLRSTLAAKSRVVGPEKIRKLIERFSWSGGRFSDVDELFYLEMFEEANKLR